MYQIFIWSRASDTVYKATRYNQVTIVTYFDYSIVWSVPIVLADDYYTTTAVSTASVLIRFLKYA